MATNKVKQSKVIGIDYYEDGRGQYGFFVRNEWTRHTDTNGRGKWKEKQQYS